MINNSHQGTSEQEPSIVTIDTMGTNMKAHYSDKLRTIMSQGKANVQYQDGNKQVQLSFRKKIDHVLITKTINPDSQQPIVLREKLMLH